MRKNCSESWGGSRLLSRGGVAVLGEHAEALGVEAVGTMQLTITRLHVRGALHNGCTKDEILEVLLQACIYCGVPAAIDSLRLVKEAFAEMEKKK